jgi:hypothetical protein
VAEPKGRVAKIILLLLSQEQAFIGEYFTVAMGQKQTSVRSDYKLDGRRGITKVNLVSAAVEVTVR